MCGLHEKLRRETPWLEEKGLSSISERNGSGLLSVGGLENSNCAVALRILDDDDDNDDLLPSGPVTYPMGYEEVKMACDGGPGNGG